MSAARSRTVTKLNTNYSIQQEITEVATTKKRKLLYRRLTAFFIFAGVIIFFMVSTYISQLSVLETKIVEKKQMDKQLASLEKQEQILEEKIANLNDDEYIAKLARSEYYLSEQNEIIFILPETEKEKSSQ